MKLRLFCVILILPICDVLGDEEVIKSQSPDGKFALPLASAVGGSAASIIDTKSHAAVLDKNEFGEEILHVSTEVPNSDGETKLVWSADSKRVAYCYHEHNRNNSGTNVEVFIWNGSKFEQVNDEANPAPLRGNAKVRIMKYKVKTKLAPARGGLSHSR